MKPPAQWRVPRELLPWTFSRPPTKFERAGATFERWAKRALLFAVVVALLGLIAIGVPTWWIVPRSDSYRAAREFVVNHDLVKRDLGSPLACEWTPSFFHFEGDRVRYAFVVESELGRAGSAEVWVAKDPSGIWHVTSAAFVEAKLGVAPRRVLLPGDAAAPGSSSR